MYEDYLGDKIQSVSSLSRLNEDLLLEMASIQTSESGLPYKLWLDPMGKDRDNEHSQSPRIKVEVDDKFIPMLITDSPDIPESVRNMGVTDFPHISVVKKYMIAYKDVLLAHFQRKISDAEALKLLRTIKNASHAKEELQAMLSPKSNGVIEYHWDEEEVLFVIEVKDENGQVAHTSYAFDEYQCYLEVDKLKNIYEIEKVIKQ